MNSKTNRILAALRSDCHYGVPGKGDPYEWATRGWMDAALLEFSRGIYLDFVPEQVEREHAARVILRLGRIKGVRSSTEIGTPAEIINAGFGLEMVKP